MNGSECKNCPVNPCETMNYRGSACAAQRAKFGLGDPQTNADRIRAMSDDELAKFIANPCECSVNPTEDGYRECGNELCKKHLLEWLKQPADQPK